MLPALTFQCSNLIVSAVLQKVPYSLWVRSGLTFPFLFVSRRSCQPGLPPSLCESFLHLQYISQELFFPPWFCLVSALSSQCRRWVEFRVSVSRISFTGSLSCWPIKLVAFLFAECIPKLEPLHNKLLPCIILFTPAVTMSSLISHVSFRESCYREHSGWKMVMKWDFIKKKMGSLQEDKCKLKKHIFTMKIPDQKSGWRPSFFLETAVNLPHLLSDQTTYHFVQHPT